MALPQQLKAARADDSTTASTLDNVVGALESALADILGFTLDVDITASPFSLNNSGQITKALVAQRAAGPVGWRMRDTASGKEVRIVVNGTNLDIDENTGSEAVPAWTNRFRMAVATGYITGALASTTGMGLCPQGDGDTNKFLDGTLTYSTPTAGTIPAVRLRHSANQSLSSGSTVSLSFDTEDFDNDTMHSTVTNTSRITCVTAGKYMVRGQVTFANNATGRRILSLVKNGVSTEGRTIENPTNGSNHSQEVAALFDLVPGDYVQLQAQQTSGSTINVIAQASFTPAFWAYKVG